MLWTTDKQMCEQRQLSNIMIATGTPNVTFSFSLSYVSQNHPWGSLASNVSHLAPCNGELIRNQKPNFGVNFTCATRRHSAEDDDAAVLRSKEGALEMFLPMAGEVRTVHMRVP